MGRHVADGALRTLAELEINRRDILKAQILGFIGFRAYRVTKTDKVTRRGPAEAGISPLVRAIVLTCAQKQPFMD